MKHDMTPGVRPAKPDRREPTERRAIVPEAPLAERRSAAERRSDRDRRQPRCDVRLATLLTLPDGQEISLQLRDISMGGFGGRSLDAVPPGSVVSIILPEVGEVPAEIVWQIGSAAGGRFLEPLALHEVSELVLKSRIKAAHKK